MTSTSATTRSAEDAPTPSGLGRIIGLDAARGLAVFGMCLVHVMPEGGPRWLLELATGRSAALFAVLAGVSLALQARGARSPDDARTVRLRITIRAVILGVLGMALALLQTPVMIILAYYAVYFVLSLPFIRLSSRALAVLAAAAAVAGPALSFVVRARLDSTGPVSFGGEPAFDKLADPVTLAKMVFFTGAYPVVTWLPFIVAGMALGTYVLSGSGARTVLTTGAVLALIGYGGSWLAQYGLGGRARLRELLEPIAAQSGLDPDQFLSGPGMGVSPTSSWWYLTLANPHSGTPFDIVGSTGVAFIVIGAAMVLCRFRGAQIALRPLIATGTAGLTSYCLHLMILAVLPPRRLDGDQVVALWGMSLWLYYVLLVAVVAVFAMAWLAFFRRGPLETVMHRATRLVRLPTDQSKSGSF